MSAANPKQVSNTVRQEVIASRNLQSLFISTDLCYGVIIQKGSAGANLIIR